MGLLVVVIFMILPLAELTVLIEVGGARGALETVALCLATAALGIALVRAQGLAVMRRAQASVARGDTPVAEVIHGVFLAVAGLLLLVPGLMTDAIGGLLLIPPVRVWAGRGVLNRLAARARAHQTGGTVIIEAEEWQETPTPGEDADRLEPPNGNGAR